MKTKAFRLLVFGLVCLVAASCSSDKVKRIGILNWSEAMPGYAKAAKGIVDGLHAAGYSEGFNITIDSKNAGSQEDAARRALSQFVRDRVDLVVVIGSAACLTALDTLKGTKIPLVFSIVNAPTAAGIIDDWTAPGRDVTGVAMDVPAAISFEKLKMILPRAKRIGVVITPKYATAVSSAALAEQAAARMGYEPLHIELAEGDLADPDARITRLPVRPDVVFFPGDPVLYVEETMQRLLAAFTKAGIPSILISDNYLKHGALFAINGDLYTMGRQTVPHITKILDGVPARDIPSERPVDTVFTLNRAAARQLGLKLGWNVLIDADIILE